MLNKSSSRALLALQRRYRTARDRYAESAFITTEEKLADFFRQMADLYDDLLDDTTEINVPREHRAALRSDIREGMLYFRTIWRRFKAAIIVNHEEQLYELTSKRERKMIAALKKIKQAGGLDESVSDLVDRHIELISDHSENTVEARITRRSEPARTA